jgi:hypothetical protein
VAPDFLEPAVGWRTWLVVEKPSGLLLRSVVFEISWPPRRELAADCEHPPPRLLSRPWHRKRAHEAPSVNCECGIYATKNVERAARYLEVYDDPPERVRHRVLGRVRLWGSVVETDFGWRASHAYPAHIYVPTHRANGRRVDADYLALGLARYRVPVEIVRGGVGVDTPARSGLKSTGLAAVGSLSVLTRLSASSAACYASLCCLRGGRRCGCRLPPTSPGSYVLGMK